MTYGKLINAIITQHVTSLSLFFKIREAKANRTIKLAVPAMDFGLARKWSSLGGRLRPCDEHKRDRVDARSSLPEIDAYVRIYYLFSLWANWYFFLKNLVICLLKHEAFAHWKHLDCLILGRYILDGRVTEAAPYVACYNAAIRLFWRYTMINQTREFRLPCIEFLLGDKRSYAQYWDHQPADQERRCEYSLLLEYQNLSGAQRAAESAYKLRPNRTRAAWDALARLTLIYFACFTVLMTLSSSLMVSLVLPVCISQSGFVLNYCQCFQWVAASHSTAANQSAYYNYFKQDIRGPTANLPSTRGNFFMPYDNLVSFNSFHIIRSSLEIIETLVIQLEIMLVVNSACFTAVIMSKDVLYYCNSINARLKRLVLAQRAAQSSSNQSSRNSYYDKLFLQGTDLGENSTTLVRQSTSTKVGCDTLGAEVSDVQAQVSDLFVQIDSYNRYITLQCLCQLFWWLSYSALVSSWIFLPGHDSPQLEWYLIHLAATCYCMLMLRNMSAVKSSCHQMYALLAVAMALDENYETSKRIWLSLMRFYSPRPMFCFTLIGSLELTSMSGLKLLAWLVGALVVASSFFQVYNIK